MKKDNKEWDNVEWEEITIEYDNLKWMPSRPDDSIQGIYITTENGTGKGQDLLFHILEDTEGQRVSILGCAKLNRLLENVAPGDKIKVIYKGEGKAQNGRPYHNYIVLKGKHEN